MYWTLTISFLLLCLKVLSTTGYRFGIGIYDITGPAADVNMMGYAKLSQHTAGIHTRLYSRAFLIADQTPDARPILFISLDIGMTSQLIKSKVILELRRKYHNEFDHQNVLISATHTHSGPGGYLGYFLYTVPSMGLVKENFNNMVAGILESVARAKANMITGKILVSEGDLYNASINRSPASYLLNPKKERTKYTHNVDTKMTLLKFVDSSDLPVGMLCWFPVHATSMNNTNKLISGDNKGLASLMFEQRFNGHRRRIGQGPFVAAFAQANEGDVSPNINGPRCIDTGKPCDFIHTTCNGHAAMCIAFGPGVDMFESTLIIAQHQVEKAWELFSNAHEELVGPVSFVHQFVNMTSIKGKYNDQAFTTCKPAMGYSFGAGTMDGPGDFDFIQGTTEESIHWNIVRDLIKKPSAELQRCHRPKPIILATGEIDHPFLWQPFIVETQIFRVGQLLMIGLPGEFTTMSGRRIREAVNKAFECPTRWRGSRQCQQKSYTVLAGLANVYTSYVATPEEYQLQRYEGASTIYGPFTLPAYVDQFSRLAVALKSGQRLSPGPEPPFLLDKLVEFLPSVWFDTAGIGRKFGQVLLQPKFIYDKIDDVVITRFVSANPRNDIRLNGTFLTVDRYDDRSNSWITEFTDANWETRFYWRRPWPFGLLIGRSEAEISWQVRNWQGGCEPGTYRIQHFGTAKPILSGSRLYEFSGTTTSFKVTCGKQIK